MNMPIGVNLSGVADWSTDFAFSNVMMQARAPSRPDAPWDAQNLAPLGPDGWPTQDFGVCVITSSVDRTGMYTLVADGYCEVAPVACPVVISNVSHTISDGKTVTTANVQMVSGEKTEDGSMIYKLYLAFTKTGGTLKNVRLYAPGCGPSSPAFTQVFISSLAKFNPLRFMDFTATNNNPVSKWAERTLPGGITQAGSKGAAWEWVIALANQAGKDIWINIPHLAADDYVANLAALLATKLAGNLNVYIEYSNETWNSQFSQLEGTHTLAVNAVAAGDKSLSLEGIDANTWYWALRWTAKRLCDITKIFRTIWGDSPRLRPVLASQIAMPSKLMEQLNYVATYYGPVNKILYASAGAPYYGIPDDLSTSTTATLEDIVTKLQSTSRYLKSGIAAYHAMPLSYGLKSAMYESGVDMGQFPQNVPIKIKSQQDPRMRAVTTNYLTDFFIGGGDLALYFNHCTAPGVKGYWGLTTDARDQTQPKFQGAVDAATSSMPAVQAGLSVGRNKFSDYTIKSRWSQNQNGDMLFLNELEDFFYLVNVPVGGLYQLSATTAAGVNLNMEVSVNGVTNTTYLTSTGNWETYKETSLGTVTLRAGLNGLRFRCKGMNLRDFVLTPSVVDRIKKAEMVITYESDRVVRQSVLPPV